MTPGPDDKRTDEQSALAERPSGTLGRETFVVAFPVPGLIPVPPSDQPFGRDDLAKHTGRDDPKASGKHFRIKRRGRLAIEDLGSTNGTWVEGLRIPPNESVALEDGALVRIGRTLLIYRRQLVGSEKPSDPIGKMVGPYGLRGVEKQLNALVASRTNRPRNVLIEGETGTGKELLAQEIAVRFRRARPFGKLNVAALAEGTIEAQLFGYAPGAFSGALPGGSRGIFLEHQGGAVFLDEIGELAPALQPKLLRLLENREVMPVGAPRSQLVDVLVIAATNRALDGMVEKGDFRRDLLTRYEQPVLRLPPLRDRREDIFAIAQAWLAENGTPLDLRETEVEAIEHLLREKWPGNIRELGGKLGEIAAGDQPGVLHAWAVEEVLGVPPASRAPLTIERARQAVATHGSVAEAAKKLGVDRSKLRRILDEK